MSSKQTNVMTTQEKNVLMAEFVGFTPTQQHGHPGYKHPDSGAFWDVREFKYHISWNALMPVVEKIENLDMADAVITIELDNCGIIYGIDKKFYAACHSKIESTYEVVVHFIQWYNENNK